MKNNRIHAIKIGNTINCSLDGVLYSKTFAPDQSRTVYGEILKYKGYATTEIDDAHIDALIGFFDIKTRIAQNNGLVLDPETRQLYLPNHNTPIPDTLVRIFDEYHDNGYPTESIVNFWKLNSTNPDERVRERLFDFITHHDFAITDNGYMVTYKAVALNTKQKDTGFETFIAESMDKVKRWKKSASLYYVYLDANDVNDKFWVISKSATLSGGHLFLGNLYEINETIQKNVSTAPTTMYTDMYTKTMKITLGQPVYMDRKDCDADPSIDCSYGLHVGATNYVKSFANKDSKILLCLVNPANVVAVPDYDVTKIRVSEYFPLCEVDFCYETKKINFVNQSYFENDYINYEKDVVADMLDSLSSGVRPISDAKNSLPENRSLDELNEIVKDRLMFLNAIV